MKTTNLTLSNLVNLTGAKPYQIKYLHSLGKLPVVRGSQGPGIPIIFSPKAVDIVNAHIKKSNIEGK